jgi:hypothetical protein
LVQYTFEYLVGVLCYVELHSILFSTCKSVPQILFFEMTMRERDALRNKTTRKFESCQSIWKIVTARSKKTTYRWTYLLGLGLGLGLVAPVLW